MSLRVADFTGGYPTKLEATALSDLMIRLNSAVEHGSEIRSLLYSDLGVQLPLHISLSRPVMLGTDERHAFSDKLEMAIRGSGVRRYAQVSSHVTTQPGQRAANCNYLQVRSVHQKPGLGL